MTGVRVGITLPSFQHDPNTLLAIAAGAEANGLDGVFAFDHLFRDDPSRPALEMSAILGAVAAETRRIALGPLVARVVTRPPRTLVTILDTVARIAPGRLIVTLGTGDAQSDPEHLAYGLRVPDVDERIAALEMVLDAAQGHGYPLWIGGASRAVWRVAARAADGWNRWGGTAEEYARQAARVATVVRDAGRDIAAFTPTWGGLVALGSSDDVAVAKLRRPRPDVLAGSPATVAELLRPYVDAGAQWIILGPVDSADAGNLPLAAEVRELLLQS
jgi:alkanesulfonate monooxygenase SsuD/methylene tetrahydromethanopterin reductase-like flavin-dependent oxidoreductase (luciferase family)